MNKFNLILNFIVVIGLFIVDGFTGSILGLFSVTLLLLFPKIRGILLDKDINSNLMYEILEFLINLYLLVIIGRALFEHSLNFNDFKVFTYSYMIVRLLLLNLILLLLNLLLFKSNNIKKKIIIDDINFSYIFLFFAIFGMYFSLTKYSNFSTIVKIILCGLSVYFCFTLINELKHKESGLYFALMIAILGVLLSNELLILAFIRTFAVTYNRDKIVFNK
mgnify:FL=1